MNTPKSERAKKCECEEERAVCSNRDLLGKNEICFPAQVPDYSKGAAERMAAVEEINKGTHGTFN